MINTNVISYIINFLIGQDASDFCEYSSEPTTKKLTIITSSFFNNSIYATDESLPKTPFSMLPNTDIPFLFGQPKIEHQDGKIILYADIIASTYFMLSRYEEIVKPKCRDIHGRFLAKDAIVFQQGYGLRPLVDEWGRYLRNLLRDVGVNLSDEQNGFSKVYLTHDVDRPFFMQSIIQVFKQYIKNFINYSTKMNHPFYTYKTGRNDYYNTFDNIITYDKSLLDIMGKDVVESIYFLISAGSKKTKNYCDIELPKYKKLINTLKESGATLGLHVSYEAGGNPNLLENEIKRLSTLTSIENLKSRHHYLRWSEPEHIKKMEQVGIKEDFTLGYADSVGFRCGTCKPYYFINPKTKALTNVLIHPMEIMEGLQEEQYMNLNLDDAFLLCRKIIDSVFKFNGELVILFHNSSFIKEFYHETLYKKLINCILSFN